MDIYDIVKKWLKENEYDGLFQEGSCGCAGEDLMCCEEPHLDCQPGYKVKCPSGGKYDYIVTPDKNQKDCGDWEY